MRRMMSVPKSSHRQHFTAFFLSHSNYFSKPTSMHSIFTNLTDAVYSNIIVPFLSTSTMLYRRIIFLVIVTNCCLFYNAVYSIHYHIKTTIIALIHNYSIILQSAVPIKNYLFILRLLNYSDDG